MVAILCLLSTACRNEDPTTTHASMLFDPGVPCAEMDRAAIRRTEERGETEDQQAARLVWEMRQSLALSLLSVNYAVSESKLDSRTSVVWGSTNCIICARWSHELAPHPSRREVTILHPNFAEVSANSPGPACWADRLSAILGRHDDRAKDWSNTVEFRMLLLAFY